MSGVRLVGCIGERKGVYISAFLNCISFFFFLGNLVDKTKMEKIEARVVELEKKSFG